jgi:ketosteroid isomerase-like protein
MPGLSDEQRSASMRGVAQQIMAAVSRLDYEALRSYLAADVVMEFPYAVPGLGPRFSGIDDVIAAMSVAPVMFNSFTWTMTDCFASPSMNSLIVRAKSEASLKGGGQYQNNYAIVFMFLEDKVVMWREYFNSLKLPKLGTEAS